MKKSHLITGLVCCSIGYLAGRLPAGFTHRGGFDLVSEEGARAVPDKSRGYFKAAGRVTSQRVSNPDGIGDEEANEFEAADLAENVRLQQLREEGECVLDLEDPLQRKVYDKARELRVQKAEETRRTRGQSEMFASLGLSDTEAAQFDRHLSQIVRAAVDAEIAISQLLRARTEYAERIRSSMNDEQSKTYRDFEQTLGVGPDVGAFSKYLAEANASPGAETLSQFEALVRNADAGTFASWEGPFDDVPTPEYGADQVIPRLEHEIAKLGDGGTRVLRLAADQGMTREMLDHIRGYYSSRLEFLEESLAGARRWSQMSPEDYKFLDGIGPRRFIPRP